MNLSDLLKPGTISFLEVGHEDGCPGRYENGIGCTCDFSIAVHQDQGRYLRGEAVNRAARRKAAREAEKALRRARRTCK